MSKKIFKAVDAYLGKLLGSEDPVMSEVEKSIRKAGLPQISISSVQGKFLHLLAKTSRARKILELGTLGGFSTIWLARALPADGKLISLEVEQVHADLARQNLEKAGLSDRVEVRVGSALDLLPQLEQQKEGPFDFIFIDADKPPYAEYFRWSLRLTKPGSLIVADNVIREGKVLDQHSKDEMVVGVQRFNEVLASTRSVTASIIQTVGAKEHDGMAIALVN